MLRPRFKCRACKAPLRATGGLCSCLAATLAWLPLLCATAGRAFPYFLCALAGTAMTLAAIVFFLGIRIDPSVRSRPKDTAPASPQKQLI